MANWSIAVRFQGVGEDLAAIQIWDHPDSSNPSIDGLRDPAVLGSDPVFHEVLASWEVIRRELGCMGTLLSELGVDRQPTDAG